jgi:hypothetical protein
MDSSLHVGGVLLVTFEFDWEATRGANEVKCNVLVEVESKRWKIQHPDLRGTHFLTHIEYARVSVIHVI